MFYKAYIYLIESLVMDIIHINRSLKFPVRSPYRFKHFMALDVVSSSRHYIVICSKLVSFVSP
jgi:hypothetical protein